MDTRIIEYVICISEEKSLTKAAEKLFITQSALSQRISKLEEELETPLFQRTRDGLVLTDAGRVYVNGGHAILQIKHRALSQLSGLHKGLDGSLHFGCATSTARDCIPAFRNADFRQVPCAD
ncbi:MAG: LysR family transcriptional regulator, partial [Lachnospiraceae bacterium]|nr:LysR family transcriptional regulator [Lachnospiraceae bacterium]